MATSIVHRDDPGIKWYLISLVLNTQAFGAPPSGSNCYQSKQFTFNKEVSWQTSFICSAMTQNDAIETHIVPVSSTVGRLSMSNMRNTAQAATIARAFFLSTDPNLTVSWS